MPTKPQTTRRRSNADRIRNNSRALRWRALDYRQRLGWHTVSTKPALSRRYRSGLEEKLAKQLDEAGVEYEYESTKIPYTVPAREAKYIPDFPIPGTNILIEAKGHWGGGRFGGIKQASAEQRQKMLLLKEQHPHLDIRVVYERASTKIYPGSPTTNAQWAETHGFMWADKGTVPESWLTEIKQQQRKRKKA